MNYKNHLGALALTFLLFACNDSGKEQPLGAYDTGILIMNEGAFGSNDGEVFHLNPTTGSIKKNVFETENNRPFAGLLEDIVLEEDRLYLVANTGKVEIVNPGDFKSIGSVIGDLDQPRSLATARGKLFISDYGPYDASFRTPNSYVAVVAGLDGGTVKKKIKVSNKPEDLFTSGKFVFVAGSEQGKIEIIDADTEEVSKTIEVLGKPVQFFEQRGDLWVYSYDSEKIYFQSFQLSNLTKKEFREFPISKATRRIALGENDRIYILTSSGWPDYNDGVAVVSLFDTTLTPSWKTGSGFYGIGYDKERQEIYVANAKGFQGNGEVTVFSKSGAEVKKMEVGRGPSGFVFR
ncbi:YncE family protein [Algoriphagus sp.]|uniref:YncE family protein n=1 Tax=Algoriphagus sp. TaxID=1872435 RepID=UPI0039189615